MSAIIIMLLPGEHHKIGYIGYTDNLTLSSPVNRGTQQVVPAFPNNIVDAQSVMISI